MGEGKAKTNSKKIEVSTEKKTASPYISRTEAITFLTGKKKNDRNYQYGEIRSFKAQDGFPYVIITSMV